jgi:catechol 2,3-dioxygenase-like lactoylglutathione lyase family enzyme
MISGVSRVGLAVEDQDRAKGFWTETMGFELVQDTPYSMGDGPQERWIEVAPPDKKVILFLEARSEDQPSRAGKLSDVLFTCDDIDKTYQELTERGVEFTEAPSQQFWGWWAVFKDPDGTLYGLGQREGEAS